MRLSRFIYNLFYQSGSFLVFICLFWACNEDKNVKIASRPEGILTDSTLVLVMRDVSLLEARVSLLKLNVDTAKAVFDSAFRKILKQHGTDSLTFDSTLRYYSRDIERIDKLYSKVLDSVNALRPERMKIK